MKVAIATSHRSVSLQRVANDIAAVLTEEGITVREMITYPNMDPDMLRGIDALLIVMTFDPFWAKPYFLMCWNAKSRGKRCIFYTTIEGYPIRYPGDQWIYRDLTFIANSRYTETRLRISGAVVTNVIYHGIDVDKIRGLKFMGKTVRSAMGFSENDFVVLYIAGSYMRKGHDLFAEACRIIQQKDRTIKVVVLTQPDAAVHYHGCENVMILTDFGKLDEAQIIGLYHSCDLYAQPSLSEGFGLPVLEALAAGKPVVHADYEPLSEITDGKTSFRVPVRAVTKKRDVGGIMFELHLYDPKDFADMILYAKDEVVKNRDEYEARCLERARRFEASRVYRAFIDELYYGWNHV